MRSLCSARATVALCLCLCVRALAAPTAADDAQRQTMAIPALGANGRLDCNSLIIEGGRLHASGNVAVRSDDFNIDCEDLVFDEANSLMEATGDRIQLEIQNMTAVCSALTYNTETGEMVLRRRSPDDAQPFVVQRGAESTLNAFADTITITHDDSGEPLTRFDGNVQLRTTSNSASPTAAATRFVAPDLAVELPGMGNDGHLTAASLTYTGGDGLMVAQGGVTVNSSSLDLECEELRYSDPQKRLVATGEAVKLRREDILAHCTELTYLTDQGRMLLSRRYPGEPQPSIWQVRPRDVFHARADLITLTEVEGGRTHVDWSENVVLENLPRPAEQANSPPTPSPSPRRIESIEDLPNAQIDPFA